MRRNENITLEDVKPFLEQLTGDGEGRIIELQGNRVSFGRGPDNDVVILSESVSRNHAAIFKRARLWFVEDSGSKNGVLVNGSFHKKTPLTPGDVLQIGDVAFRFSQPRSESVAFEPSAIKRRPFETKSYHEPKPADVNAFIESVENRLVQLKQGGNRLSFYLLSVLGLTGMIFICFPQNKRVKPIAVSRATVGGGDEVRIAPLPGEEGNRAPAERIANEMPESASLATPRLDLAMPSQPLAKRPAETLNDSEEVVAYIEEGRKFLRHRDFESAAKAFQFALIIDTENENAMRGIYAAEHRMSDLEEVPLNELPEIRKNRARKNMKRDGRGHQNEKAGVLIEKARRELVARSYTAALNAALSVQKLRLSKDSELHEEAAGIAAKARQARKEEFEPFLLQAKDKLAAEEFRAARNLCDEILRRDPAYEEAKDCLRRAVRGQ